jgi:hypothetical protein
MIRTGVSSSYRMSRVKELPKAHSGSNREGVRWIVKNGRA